MSPTSVQGGIPRAVESTQQMQADLAIVDSDMSPQQKQNKDVAVDSVVAEQKQHGDLAVDSDVSTKQQQANIAVDSDVLPLDEAQQKQKQHGDLTVDSDVLPLNEQPLHDDLTVPNDNDSQIQESDEVSTARSS